MSLAPLLIPEGLGWLASTLEEEKKKYREVKDGGHTWGQ